MTLQMIKDHKNGITYDQSNQILKRKLPINEHQDQGYNG
jgi:hypothetical protein